MLFRYILVNSFSFIKRFFSFYPPLYKFIVFIPALTVITFSASRRSLNFVLLFSLVILVSGNIKAYEQFILYFLLILAVPMFKRVNFEELVQRSYFFFILVSLYGIYQKVFGYTSVEINWILSGLSFAEERAFIASSDIRPFSTFASMPEFTLFISIYLYYFKSKGKTLLLFFTFVMLYIAGSRGVFVAVITAYFFVFILKKFMRKHLFLSFLSSLLIFLFLIFIFPMLFSTADYNSRMLAYGTFNGRVELLASILDVASPSSLFTGVDLSDLNIEHTFDNLYFMLVANFGIFGALYFILFFIKQKDDKKSFFFITIFLGYGFYADMVFSYYLMFLFFVAIYSQSTMTAEARMRSESSNLIRQ